MAQGNTEHSSILYSKVQRLSEYRWLVAIEISFSKDKYSLLRLLLHNHTSYFLSPTCYKLIYTLFFLKISLPLFGKRRTVALLYSPKVSVCYYHNWLLILRICSRPHSHCRKRPSASNPNAVALAPAPSNSVSSFDQLSRASVTG